MAAGCCKPEDTSATQCPTCGSRAKSVPLTTVKHLSAPKKQLHAGPYYICTAPSCNVVYFGGDHTLGKCDLRVRVGIKETEDPIPVCYCFEFTERMIQDEARRLGLSRIQDQIKRETRSGACECEIKNPEGRCCLGNVARVS